MLRKPIKARSIINRVHDRKEDQENRRWIIYIFSQINVQPGERRNTHEEDGKEHARLPGMKPEVDNVSLSLRRPLSVLTARNRSCARPTTRTHLQPEAEANTPAQLQYPCGSEGLSQTPPGSHDPPQGLVQSQCCHVRLRSGLETEGRQRLLATGGSET